MPFGWDRKKDETEEDFKARIEEKKAQAQANLQRGRENRKTDRKPKDTTAAPAVTKKALATTVGLINGLVAMFSPPDALGKVTIAGSEIDESEMLVDALLETQQTSPLFRKYLGRFVGVAGQASLLGAVGLIVYVRLERRGIVPALSGGAAAPIQGSADASAPAQGIPMSEAQFWGQKEWERNNPQPQVEVV